MESQLAHITKTYEKWDWDVNTQNWGAHLNLGEVGERKLEERNVFSVIEAMGCR